LTRISSNSAETAMALHGSSAVTRLCLFAACDKSHTRKCLDDSISGLWPNQRRDCLELLSSAVTQLCLFAACDESHTRKCLDDSTGGDGPAVLSLVGRCFSVCSYEFDTNPEILEVPLSFSFRMRSSCQRVCYKLNYQAMRWRIRSH
jgi:hypothetical protein